MKIKKENGVFILDFDTKKEQEQFEEMINANRFFRLNQSGFSQANCSPYLSQNQPLGSLAG